MNNWRCKVLCALFVFSLSGVAADKTAPSASLPNRYVIGISPFLENTVKDDVYRRIVSLLLEDVPLNSSMAVFDAWNIKTIAQVNIPEVRAFRSPKTRANQFKEQIHKIKDFLATKHERPQVSGLKFEQALRLPQFMDFVAQNLQSSNVSTVVILLGSPLYVDPKETRFSMADAYFPSDGHLLASPDKSIFSVKNRASQLTGVTVHMGYFGDPWPSELYQQKILRFWDLFLSAQGARLASFSGDLPTTFNSARNSESLVGTHNSNQIDHRSTKVEMIRITRDVETADWITRDVVHAHLLPPSTTTGPMKLGIRWKGNIDLDLYATPAHGAETLYFEHTRSAQGYYFKDHRSSPEREYEFVEFESPINVWQVEARVNFFEGHDSGGPSGEVRIEFDGKIYTGKFSLSASHGNEGREGGRQKDYWTTINIPEILKLKSETDQASSR
jgi:hypothetical protein